MTETWDVLYVWQSHYLCGVPVCASPAHALRVCFQNCDVLDVVAPSHYAFMGNCWWHFSLQLILILMLGLGFGKRPPADLLHRLMLWLVFTEPQLFELHSHSCEVRWSDEFTALSKSNPQSCSVLIGGAGPVLITHWWINLCRPACRQHFSLKFPAVMWYPLLQENNSVFFFSFMLGRYAVLPPRLHWDGRVRNAG